ncbi:hypothetical protein [Thermococcus sp.]|uniref:hypothetical protein n=1 Tax=Thermococcus sp. TaxID=35749 RepID=UPI00263701D7|nr:hypothetical protein [Thermococcus sp.]
MDELEFCLKSLSYPLGMLLEGMKRSEGPMVIVEGQHITIPRVPFAARCYLLARAFYESLDVVDRKRLADDWAYIEDFAKRVISSPLGERLRDYMERADDLIEVRTDLTVNWLEFERRAERVRPILRKILVGEEPEGVGGLSVDECLLLSYLSGGRKKREFINAFLGKRNPTFREAVKAYFRALRS